MAANLSEILKSTEMFRKRKKGKIGKKWLGKSEGAVPSGKISMEYLKELRKNIIWKDIKNRYIRQSPEFS